jgi:hypothetical protein
MYLAKIILFVATAITPAEMVDEEELLLSKKVALIEDEEICDGEFVFEDDLLVEEENKEFSDLDQE